MRYLELWMTGRFDEALDVARASDDKARDFAAKADARLRLLREHGILVYLRAAPGMQVLELNLGGSALRLDDGCLREEEMRPYLCDPREQDVEPFLAALARAAEIELPPASARRPGLSRARSRCGPGKRFIPRPTS